jgi:hypothetical protein
MYAGRMISKPVGELVKLDIRLDCQPFGLSKQPRLIGVGVQHQEHGYRRLDVKNQLVADMNEHN